MQMNIHIFLKKIINSISGKIFIFMFCAILPLNFLVIASTSKSVDVVEEQARISMENSLNQQIQKLDSRIFSIHYYFYNLYENDVDFIRLSQQTEGTGYRLSQTNIARKFRTNIETSQSADGYFYYSSRLNDLILILPNSYSNDESLNNRAVQDFIKDYLLSHDVAEITGWNRIIIESSEWLLRVYENDGFYYGALISLEQILSQIKNSIEFKELKVQIADEITKDDPDFLTVYGLSSKSKIQFKLLAPRAEIIKTLPVFQRLAIILSFVYLLLIPLLFWFLNKHLLRPLNKIRFALLKLKSGDKNYRISNHNYSEEFLVINRSFNEMADSIENLKIENYEKEMERQKMQFRNLQLQIHPHFLLNMFKLIYGLAQIQGYKSIQKLALYLSNYFRYIFRSGKDLETFEQEYNLIREYLNVSAIRYPNLFTVEYKVETSVLSMEIPPLLLHNFVENIINHALNFKDPIHIQFCAQYENGFAKFIIEDDGVGISPEIVERINKHEFISEHDGQVHLGLQNSYQRLKYFYGEESTLSVDSELGKGTRFTIRIPIKEKRE